MFFPVLAADRVNQRSFTERCLYAVFGPLVSLFLPSLYTPLADLGSFTLDVAMGKWPNEELFRNARLRELSKSV